MSCRGPAIVGLHADLRQRIYSGQDRHALAGHINRSQGPPPPSSVPG